MLIFVRLGICLRVSIVSHHAARLQVMLLGLLQHDLQLLITSERLFSSIGAAFVQCVCWSYVIYT